jgi:hypothetical protein
MCTAENMVSEVSYITGCVYIVDSTSEYLFIPFLKLSVLHKRFKFLKWLFLQLPYSNLRLSYNNNIPVVLQLC